MSRKAPAPISGTSSRRELLLGIVAVALVARVAATLLAGGEAFRFVDEAIYVDAAQRLRSGAGFGADYTNVPGYPAFLALLGVVVPGGVLALRAGQATLVALGALLCFALGRRLDGDRAGLAAAALYGLDPVLVVSAVLLYPEAIAGLLLTGSLLAAWEALRRDRLFLVFVAAVHLGVFTLFRPVGLGLVPVMVGWLGLAPGRSWKRKTTYVAVLTGVWLLVLLPWIYRGYRVHGRILPVATIGISGVPVIGFELPRRGVAGAVLSAAERDPAGFAGRTLREFGHFWEPYPTRLVTDDPSRRAGFARQDPRVASEPLLRRSLRDVVSAFSFGLELALAAIGLVVGWRHRRRETVWLAAVVLSFALGYALFYGKLRYRIPILPIVLCFGGVGLVALTGRLDRPHPPDPVGPARARSQQ